MPTFRLGTSGDRTSIKIASAPGGAANTKNYRFTLPRQDLDGQFLDNMIVNGSPFIIAINNEKPTRTIRGKFIVTGPNPVDTSDINSYKVLVNIANTSITLSTIWDIMTFPFIYFITAGGQGVETLAELTDTDIDESTPLVSGHAITYNSVTGKWVNGPVGGVSALNDLTDVTAPTPSDGQALIFNNGTGQWENQTLPAGKITGFEYQYVADYNAILVDGQFTFRLAPTKDFRIRRRDAYGIDRSAFVDLNKYSRLDISDHDPTTTHHAYLFTGDDTRVGTVDEIEYQGIDNVYRAADLVDGTTYYIFDNGVYENTITRNDDYDDSIFALEGQVITWNNTKGKFEPRDVPVVDHALEDHTNVNVTNLSDNDVLRWDSNTNNYINELKGQVPTDTGANINPPIAAYDTAGQVLYNETIEKLYFGKGGTTVEEVVSFEPSFGYNNISDTNPDVWLQPQNIGGTTGNITWTPTFGSASVLAQGSNSQISTVGTKQAIETDATINGFVDIDLGQNVTGANGFTLGVVVYDLLSVQGQRQVTLYSGTGGDFFDPKNILLMYCNGGKVEGFFNQLTSMPYSGTTLPFTPGEPSFFVFRYDPATNLFTVYRQRATDVQVYSIVPADFNGAIAMDNVLANQLLFGREYSNSSFSAFKFSEIIFWNRYLSNTELTNVSKGMMEEYSLRVAPVVDANLSLNQLSDVTLTNPSIGQQLVLNGANEWVNGVGNSQIGHQMIYRNLGVIPTADGEWSFTGSALLISKKDVDGNDLTFLVGVPIWDVFQWYHRSDKSQFAYSFTNGARIDQTTYWEFPAQALLGISEDGAPTIMIWSPNVRELTTKMQDVSDTAATIQGQVLAWDVPQGEYQPKLLALNDLSDTTISAPSNFQVLKYFGGQFINALFNINEANDTNFVSLVPWQKLVYDGNDWVNRTSTSGQIKVNSFNTNLTSSAKPTFIGLTTEQEVVYRIAGETFTTLNASSFPTTSVPLTQNGGVYSDVLFYEHGATQADDRFKQQDTQGLIVEYRVELSYTNKTSSNSGRVQLRLYNPDSGFSLENNLPLAQGITSDSGYLEFITISDSANVGPGLGYKMGVSSTSSLDLIIDSITCISREYAYRN